MNPNPPVQILTGDTDDLDAAWAWLCGVLEVVPDIEKRELLLRAVPALPVLLAYREILAETPYH